MSGVSAIAKTEELDETLAALNMEGHWKTNRDGLPAEPIALGQPCLWRWADIYPNLVRAGELLGIEGGASRRTIRLCTPGIPGKSTTQTIHTSIQMVKPGEVAEAHRHSIGAFRFVIQGAGAHTTVDGERFVMEPNDLVLTPQWSWHDHGNESDEPIVWIDGHDLPLLKSLNLLFFQKHNSRQQTVTRSEGHARKKAGAVRPKAVLDASTGVPYIYKGREALDLVQSLGDEAWDAFDGRTLDYVNPFTGGSTLPTIACRLHRLGAGEETQRHRHTASTIYHVVAGRGASAVGERRIEWGPRDMFVVPNWIWHAHAAQSDAVLFSITDEPILQALGHMRTETATDGASAR